MHEIKGYRKEIEELKETITPTTPPEVLAEREHHAALQTNEIAREAM